MEFRGVKRSDKRGQLTIFIIIAVLLVGLVLAGFFLYPKLKSSLSATPINPQSFIQTCLESDIKNTVDKLSLQGGSINPVAYTLYQDNKVEYLCYTNQMYLPCTMQQPMLKAHI